MEYLDIILLTHIQTEEWPYYAVITITDLHDKIFPLISLSP